MQRIIHTHSIYHTPDRVSKATSKDTIGRLGLARAPGGTLTAHTLRQFHTDRHVPALLRWRYHSIPEVWLLSGPEDLRTWSTSCFAHLKRSMLGTPRFTPTVLTSPHLHNNALTLYRIGDLCNTVVQQKYSLLVPTKVMVFKVAANLVHEKDVGLGGL